MDGEINRSSSCYNLLKQGEFMGKAIDYITVDHSGKIEKAAREFAFYNVDRYENPEGSYHGNLTILTGTVFDSYEAAYDYLTERASKAPSFHDFAVSFKQRESKEPTKTILELSERLAKHRERLGILSKKLRDAKTLSEQKELRGRIRIWTERAMKCQAQLEEASLRNTILTGKILWLVRVSVHC